MSPVQALSFRRQNRQGESRDGQAGHGCSTRTRSGAGGPGLLAQRPASQEDGKGEGGEDHHGSRDNPCQPEGNLVRLANPRVLVSVHLPVFLLDKRVETILVCLTGRLHAVRGSEHTVTSREITGRCKYVADAGMRRSRNRTARFSYGWYVASLRQDEIRSVAEIGELGLAAG